MRYGKKPLLPSGFEPSRAPSDSLISDAWHSTSSVQIFESVIEENKSKTPVKKVAIILRYKSDRQRSIEGHHGDHEIDYASRMTSIRFAEISLQNLIAYFKHISKQFQSQL